ncbi:MAG: hypothetical protein FWF15_02595 [Oscillospiraceae bacterium]|nr:hypothetical protein [Oscillospiraceae bacterium]
MINLKYSYNGNEIHPSIDVVSDIVPYLGGITMKEFYTDYKKCAEAWKIAAKALKDYYGDLFPIPRPSGAPLSYGHLVSIGAPIFYPEDGEPNVKPFADSTDEAIEILSGSKDFSDNPLFQHYMDMSKYFADEFYDGRFYFLGAGAQGPLTSAVLMRGLDFLFDIYDEPEKSKDFLYLMTNSIIGYQKFCRRINGEPEITNGGGMTDDFASLIPPDMWDEFVIPYINQEFEGLSNGAYRYMHIENLTPKHLKHLKTLKLNHYQPTVSAALTIENIKENTDIPFDWTLPSYVLTEMTEMEIEDWIDSTVHAGITSIHTEICAFTAKQNKLDKAFAFLKGFEKYEVKL